VRSHDRRRWRGRGCWSRSTSLMSMVSMRERKTPWSAGRSQARWYYHGQPHGCRRRTDVRASLQDAPRYGVEAAVEALSAGPGIGHDPGARSRSSWCASGTVPAAVGAARAPLCNMRPNPQPRQYPRCGSKSGAPHPIAQVPLGRTAL
jgi:hypothetical protein